MLFLCVYKKYNSVYNLDGQMRRKRGTSGYMSFASSLPNVYTKVTCILSVRKNTFCVIARSEFF